MVAAVRATGYGQICHKGLTRLTINALRSRMMLIVLTESRMLPYTIAEIRGAFVPPS